MQFITDQGPVDSVWIEGHDIDRGMTGSRFRLAIGEKDGVICTEAHVPAGINRAAIDQFVISTIVAIGNRARPATCLMSDDGRAARIVFDEDDNPADAEVNGEIHHMSADQLTRYAPLTPAVLYTMVAQVALLPIIAAGLGWFCFEGAAGPARLAGAGAMAVLALLMACWSSVSVIGRLGGGTPLIELGARTVAVAQERERRQNPPRIVAIS